jgi:hypothetical protein
MADPGHPDDERHRRSDEILDNITLFWLTNTGVSARVRSS